MSLPVGEQQILDGIAETLRASEPRLASMFAIFGRLFIHEGPPLRERLPAVRPFARLAALRNRLPSMRASRLRTSHLRGPGMRRASSRRASWRGSRHLWKLVFVFGNVVAAVVLLAFLIGLNTRGARDCAQRPAPVAQAFVYRSGNCPAQAGSSGSALQK